MFTTDIPLGASGKLTISRWPYDLWAGDQEGGLTLSTIMDKKIHAIVNLVPNNEGIFHDGLTLRSWYESHRSTVKVIPFPMKNTEQPELGPLRALIKDVVTMLESGKNVNIHGNEQATDRAPLIAACLARRLLGLRPQKAMDMIRESVPDSLTFEWEKRTIAAIYIDREHNDLPAHGTLHPDYRRDCNATVNEYKQAGITDIVLIGIDVTAARFFTRQGFRVHEQAAPLKDEGKHVLYLKTTFEKPIPLKPISATLQEVHITMPFKNGKVFRSNFPFTVKEDSSLKNVREIIIFHEKDPFPKSAKEAIDRLGIKVHHFSPAELGKAVNQVVMNSTLGIPTLVSASLSRCGMIFTCAVGQSYSKCTKNALLQLDFDPKWSQGQRTLVSSHLSKWID